MFEQAVSKSLRQNLEILGKWPPIKDFYLAGGTAVALQIGHRISEDLDFFSRHEFEVDKLIIFLSEKGQFELDKKLEDTILGSFNGLRVSFFYYPYKLLEGFLQYGSINLASLIDIACMKIDSISSRGLKRDFVDLYFILRQISKNLNEILELFKKRYEGIEYNLHHIKKSLVYFENADNEPDPDMLVSDFSWNSIKDFFQSEIKNLG